jgi:microcystin-dependent protein
MFSVGLIVFVSPVGYLSITAIATDTLTLQNLGYTVNQAAGSTALSGNTVTGTGPQGPQGITGAAGAQGIQGPQGVAGSPGAIGSAATVAIGTTTTGTAGSQANVTNTGTGSAAVFNFTIPTGTQGPAGTAGATGPAGAAGSPGIQGPVGPTGGTGSPGNDAFTTVNTGFTVPPVGQTVTIYVADSTFATIGELVYVAGAGTGGTQAGALQVTAKAPGQLTLLNPVPPPAIPPADNTQPGLLNKLSGNSTDYVGGDNNCHTLNAVPTGTVHDFAGPLTAVPVGYLGCDGTIYNISQYPTLGALLGATFGGDGTTTFAVPDCRSRSSIGSGQGTGLTNRVLGANGGEETHVLSVAELANHAHGWNDSGHAQYIQAHGHGWSDSNHNHVLPVHGHGWNDSNHYHAIANLAGNGNMTGGSQASWNRGGGNTNTGYESNVVGSVANAAAMWNNSIASTAATYGGPSTCGSVDNMGAFWSGGPNVAVGSVAANGSSTAHNTMMPFICFNKIIKT